ncbi:MAG TPA: tRNA pseudouridine(55) synthase TruB [Vicinamibacteria bacterium]|nr:tRNA pseudouridine(55) synthase TruB [Vicinamibacteria bacterium]
MTGTLLVDKPEGLTSHDVVHRVRRATGIRRVGHTGTLDPFATGLLILCIGRSTRLARFLSPLSKDYVATVRFGFATDTYDRTGKIVGEPVDGCPPEDEIRGALSTFLGVQDQIPPPFSAKRVGGTRSYRLARAGKAVAHEAIRVHVLGIELLELAPPLARLFVSASGGTYVRSLAHDLGGRLGTGAHLEALRRTAIGSFRLDEALPLRDVEELAAHRRLRERILAPSTALRDLAAVSVDQDAAMSMALGQDIPWAGRRLEGSVRVLDPDGELVAVAGLGGSGSFLRPLMVWATEKAYRV